VQRLKLAGKRQLVFPANDTPSNKVWVLFMSNSAQHLKSLYTEAFRQIERNRPTPEVEIRFYPYAGINHTIRLRSGRIYVRIADIFRNAPLNVQRALAFILVAKLLRRRTPEVHDRVYRDYACQPEVLRAAEIARRHRGRKVITSARGSFYDLERLFNQLNKRYFENKLPKPTLTWSRTRTRRILGHHDAAHETIVISKTLDSADVPQWFVEYILYHEMLHIKHPARLINGRLYHHTKSFRADEQRFPYYEAAQEFLEELTRTQRSQRTQTRFRARAA
jgi:predicted metal-dependent hydrolase